MRSNSKHYADHHQCAHAWAHQLTEAGHASNFYFTGRTIFSYGSHFPIATIDGDRVFFTTERYSTSTAKHVSRARSAVSHLNFVFVKHVPLSSNPATDESFIRENIKDWVSEIQLLLSTFERYPRRKSLQLEIEAIVCRLRAFVSELSITPDRELLTLLDHPSLTAITQLNKATAKKAAEAEKKKMALLSKLFTATRKAWRDEVINKGSLQNPLDANLAYLRWNENTVCVETSKGIEVPVAVAKKCYDFLQSQLPSGCSTCNFSLLGFRVTSITPEFLTVGCHKIPMAEVAAIAEKLNWIANCP